MKIGVISDTHNYLDPRIPELFEGVDHVLHAGDIGMPAILYQLEEIASVTAVLGNTDDPGFRWRLTETAHLGGRKFMVHHIVDPHSPDPALLGQIRREQLDVVVFGHTHRPFCQEVHRVLFFNPGYAGKPRLGLPRSVAILHCTGKTVRAEYLVL